jgi:acid stress chaperone HdeB
MNPVPWLQMTNMISYQGLVRTFPKKRYLTSPPG